jgi:hypothetical protein
MKVLLLMSIFICSHLIADAQDHVAEESAVGCPPEGLYHYPHPEDCDKYYLCRNGTLTYEECPNGLLYQEHGAVFEFCAYNWNVECPKEKRSPAPISTPGCPWQFGLFAEDSSSGCAPTYSECIWGVPERRWCEPKGLLWDDRIHGCQWPDKLGCKAAGEQVIGFKCPEEDTKNIFYPFPRYAYSDNAIITCVDSSPRLVHCGADEFVDQKSLTCTPYEKI